MRFPRNRRARLLGAGLLASAGLWPGLVPAAVIPEPDTVLYGRIVNRSGPAEHLVTSGTLTWKFLLPGGEERAFTASLEPLQNGTISYQLRLPHSLLGSGLQSEPGSLPLSIDRTTYVFGDIAVNGARAVANPEQALAVVVNQENRAQALRVDLSLDAAMPDTDGDGMPDWWETAHELDPYSAADAVLDPDGDGLTNLVEWRRALPPRVDNRVPALAGADLSVYPQGTSGVALRVVDTDTTPDQLVLLVTSAPQAGEILVRRDAGDRVLRRGDRLTALEAHEGRLHFRSGEAVGASVSSVRLGLVLVDDAAAVAAMAQSGWTLTEAFLAELPQAEVRLRFVREAVETPAAGWELVADSATSLPGLSETSALRAKAALFASHGQMVVWDVVDDFAGHTIHPPLALVSTPEAQAQRSVEPAMYLLGSSGDDMLTGGGGADVIYGGTGDDSVTGGLGADRFVIGSGGGRTLVQDFNPGQGDQVDLSRVFAGKSGYADDSVRFVSEPSGASSLQVFAGPAGQGDPVAVVSFASHQVTADSFPRLVDQRAILLGDASVRPLLSVSAVEAATENGLKPARLVVRRLGGVATALTVPLSYGGSATAGVDYQPPAASLAFAAGQAELELLIRPYSDGLSEADESVRVSIVESPAYRVSSAEGVAEVLIRDLLPEFQLSVTRPEVVFLPSSPGQVRIRRDGLIDRQVLLELEWTGPQALSWLDPLPQFVDFGRGETSRLIDLRPKAGESKPAQPLVLTLRLVSDPAYLLGEARTARFNVVPAALGFSDWLTAEFPGLAGGPAAGTQDPGDHGVRLLERFAFALSPQRPDQSAAAMPRIVERQGRLGLEFVLRPGALGVAVAVETSSTLNQWSGGAAVVGEVFPAPGEAPPPGWRRFEAKASAGPAPRYFRVRLTQTP